MDTSGNLVYYDFGMMDEPRRSSRRGSRSLLCFGCLKGAMIDDIQLGVKAKQLVDAVETAGVLAKGRTDCRPSKCSRYFIRRSKIAVERPVRRHQSSRRWARSCNP